tara:strand:+ start:9266 stop:9508 length:243 start_codon:yes stop_codon:yes gene_type:complete
MTSPFNNLKLKHMNKKKMSNSDRAWNYHLVTEAINNIYGLDNEFKIKMIKMVKDDFIMSHLRDVYKGTKKNDKTIKKLLK